MNQMKQMNRIFAIFALVVLTAIGCKGQVPPSPSPTATVTWTASISCTAAAPCVYVISRAACTSTCPATSGTSYVQIGTTASNATTFTDSTLSAGSWGWIVQAQQGTPVLTSQPSGISNGGAPTVVTGPPAAPTAPNVTAQAEMVRPSVGGPKEAGPVTVAVAPTGVTVCGLSAPCPAKLNR
jgi:hypothetical protein